MEAQQNKYQLFLNWFKNNGGKYQQDMIQYPVYYHPGDYPGVGAKIIIPRNRVIVAIPFNLIITVNKVKQELKQLYEDVYKHENDQEDDLEFLVLTLYLTYHKQKEKQSFFYPYLNIVDSPQNMSDWHSQQVSLVEDPYLMGLVNEQKDQIPYLFDTYRKYTQKYKNLFEAPVTMKQFIWSLNFVQTRCYGWGFPETLLAPFADLFNHHSLNTINHYTFKRKYEIKESIPHPAYIVKADCLNLELLGIESREIKNYEPNQKIKVLKETFPEVQQKQLIQQEDDYWTQYLKRNLLAYPKSIETFDSDDSEDNDSEDQQQDNQDTFEAKINVLKIKENPPNSFVKLQLKEFNRPSLPINREFQEECDFSWYRFDDKDTYFIISTGRETLKGEQLFNSYGQRSNRFLLLWYGFALIENKFNSVCFRLVIQSEKIQVYQKYVTQEQIQEGLKIGGKKIEVGEYLTQQFRLKESRLCEKLIFYLRFKLLKKSKDMERKVTFPTNLKNQLQMLDLYAEAIQQLRKYYNSYTLEEDKKILKTSGLKERHVYALIHRISNKRIIQIQWSLVQISKRVIFELIDKKNLTDALNSPRVEQRDDLFDNKEGRVFYARRLLGYLRPLDYLIK